MKQGNPHTLPDAACAPARPLADDYYHPPKLTIAHLLAWITLAAVGMKVAVVYELGRWTLPESMAWLIVVQKAITCSSAAFFAAGILGTLVILRDKLRGIAGRLQPGHWLVVILSIQFFSRTLIWLAEGLALPGPVTVGTHPESLLAAVTTLLHTAIALAVTLAFLRMAIKVRAGWQWQVLAGAWAINAATTGLSFVTVAGLLAGVLPLDCAYPPILSSLVTPIGYFTLFILLVTALIDLAQRRRRDGLHWLGVALAAWVCANPLIWLVASLVHPFT